MEQYLTIADLLPNRKRDFETLQIASQQLNAIHTVQELLQTLLHAAITVVGAKDASIWLWADETLSELVCKATSNRYRTARLREQRLVKGQGIIGWVAEQGKSTISADVSHDIRFFSSIDEQIGFVTRSLLAVPLRFGEQVLGVLGILNKPTSFDEGDMILAETLATSATIALQNARLLEKLNQQTAELTERNRYLDAFSRSVAHDLKTPLHWIKGYAELLYQNRTTISPADSAEYAEEIYRGTYKMEQIIDDLLLLAQIHRPEQLQLIDNIAMGDIVSLVLERLSPQLEEKSAEIESTRPLPLVRGHATWLESVWFNYITNAIKYGGLPLHITIGYDEYPQQMLRFWLKDNGQGIAPEAQSRLFREFSRVDSTYLKGYGLGLTIARYIIEKLGGEVGLESAVGEGSKFWFTLPKATV